MEILDLGKRREVCWDEALMDKCENVRVEMHKPKFANVALECNAPWEGTVSGYFTIIPDGLTTRMYYRGAQLMQDEDGSILPSHPTYFCYAESRDGKHFERKKLVDCQWCKSLSGTFDYQAVRASGSDVYKRHESCRCVVTYIPDKGQNIKMRSRGNAFTRF